MYYSTIKKFDIANGPGCRVTLFVSGCRRHCPGCHNPETWDFHAGQIFTNRAALEIIDALDNENIQGLTIMGGEPLEPENQETVLGIIQLAKDIQPEKDIWLYTGFSFEPGNIPTNNRNIFIGIMELIDVLVDGEYREDERDITLRFRGSRNQRIIDMVKTLEAGKVVLWEGI